MKKIENPQKLASTVTKPLNYVIFQQEQAVTFVLTKGENPPYIETPELAIQM